MIDSGSTIAAISTAAGSGAIAVVRVSGPGAITVVNRLFVPRGLKRDLAQQPANTVQLGNLLDGNRLVDEVMVTVFRAPRSYTGQDMVEISCHGSTIIQQQILALLIAHGATLAQPGEFTLRAFLNGKLDLSQAEGVADLIAASNETARRVAFQQMRGGISLKLKDLREQLLHFSALVELELDFSEEDVELADRSQLETLVLGLRREVQMLIDSFERGNAIKNGLPVAIAGRPNVGKSTLLNRLLHEERAIVSDVAGTTRDSIEDCINIGGHAFRLIDTAGLRQAADKVEAIGIERAWNKIGQAQIVMYLLDAQQLETECLTDLGEFAASLGPKQRLLAVLNKEDRCENIHTQRLADLITTQFHCSVVAISAKRGDNIDRLTAMLVELAELGQGDNQDVVVTSVRHRQALVEAQSALDQVLSGIRQGLSGDLLAIDIRQVLQDIGTITGEVTNEEILGDIFSKFCIGK